MYCTAVLNSFKSILFSREAFTCIYCVFSPLPGSSGDRKICLCGSVVSLNYKVKPTPAFSNRLGKVHIASFFSFRTHNTLYAPEMLAKMVEPFTKALDMLEVEKSAILGKTSSLVVFFFP